MTQAIATPNARSRDVAAGAVLQPRKARPVLFWAGLGVAFTALSVYLFGAFVAGGPTTTPDGPTPIPTHMKVTIHAMEIIGVPAIIGFLYYFLVRPWRREGKVSLDGIFCLVFAFTLYWQDTAINIFQNTLTYNTAFLNFGGWNYLIPGWFAPNGDLQPQPILWSIPVYVVGLFGTVLICNVIMGRARSRWPQLGTLGLVLIAYAFNVIVDALLEPTLMAISGAFAYPGAIPWLTVFHGHYFQYPIYEGILWGGAMTGFACLRFFKDDRGQTFAARGIDRLSVSQRAKTWLLFFALAGACNTFYLGYNLAIGTINLHGGPWPEDILKRSYLVDGFCGEGTTYACPGPNIPVPHRDSSHLDPDGKVVPVR